MRKAPKALQVQDGDRVEIKIDGNPFQPMVLNPALAAACFTGLHLTARFEKGKYKVPPSDAFQTIEKKRPEAYERLKRLAPEFFRLFKLDFDAEDVEVVTVVERYERSAPMAAMA